MRLPFFNLLCLVLGTLSVRAASSSPVLAPAEAVFVIVGDQHSAYERAAQLVGRVDRLRAENPGLPLGILLDGDVFEYGNVVARRSAGAVDFALLAALARRAPTLVNLGNHEPEFYDLRDTIERLRATGAVVIGNIVDHTTGAPFVASATPLKLGKHDAVVAGFTTDLLASFRLAVRPSLDLAEPVAWARQNLPALLQRAPVKIVLSHAGLLVDRRLLDLVPDGTLFAGAHDHVRFIHRQGRTVYVHSGAWNEFLTLAFLRTDAAGNVSWEVRQERIELTDPVDPGLAALIQETEKKYLTPEDTAVVGRVSRALTPDEAAAFAVRAVREAAGVDVALVGRTTFGAGLAAGPVSRVALDAWVRFDSVICTADVSGAQLQAMLARANETADTPLAQRQGDYLVAGGVEQIDMARRYRIATTDWVARNPAQYLGTKELVLQERPELRLKEIVLRALNPKAGATAVER